MGQEKDLMKPPSSTTTDNLACSNMQITPSINHANALQTAQAVAANACISKNRKLTNAKSESMVYVQSLRIRKVVRSETRVIV